MPQEAQTKVSFVDDEVEADVDVDVEVSVLVSALGLGLGEHAARPSVANTMIKLVFIFCILNILGTDN